MNEWNIYKQVTTLKDRERLKTHIWTTKSLTCKYRSQTSRSFQQNRGKGASTQLIIIMVKRNKWLGKSSKGWRKFRIRNVHIWKSRDGFLGENSSESRDCSSHVSCALLYRVILGSNVDKDCLLLSSPHFWGFCCCCFIKTQRRTDTFKAFRDRKLR